MCDVPEGRHVTIATPSLGADGVMMDQGPAWGIAARGEMMALSPTAQQMTAQQMTSVQAIGGTSLSAQLVNAMDTACVSTGISVKSANTKLLDPIVRFVHRVTMETRRMAGLVKLVSVTNMLSPVTLRLANASVWPSMSLEDTVNAADSGKGEHNIALLATLQMEDIVTITYPAISITPSMFLTRQAFRFSTFPLRKMWTLVLRWRS